MKKMSLNVRFNCNCHVEMLHWINLQILFKIFTKLKKKTHPFPLKMCPGFSWSRTTGFSRP